MSIILAVPLVPRSRANNVVLALCCAALFVSIWMEKGWSMIVTRFVPSPTGQFKEYRPTGPGLRISVGVYGAGAFPVTVLLKVLAGVKAGTECAERRLGIPKI